MSTEDQSQIRKSELESEISRLEALAEPSPEDVEQVEKLKDQLAAVQDIDLTNEESSGIHFRSLTETELKRLSEFASRSKNFAKLPVEEKVDRLALAVTQGFGFGSFNADLLREGSKAFMIPTEFPYESYLESHSSGAGGKPNRYTDVGKKSFKLDRVYLAKLLGAGSEPAETEEPIRKKVQASQPRPIQAPAPIVKKASPPQRSARPQAQKSTRPPSVQSSESDKIQKSQKSRLLPAVLIGLVVLGGVLFFLLSDLF